MGESDKRLARFIASDGAGLLRFAYLLCRDAGRAEDLVQDALVRILQRWRSGGSTEHEAAYARRVITNAYVDWRRLRVSGEVVTDLRVEVLEPDRSDAQADRDLVWRTIGSLPPRQRAVLVLRYYEQLTDAEIADVLGCAPATVRSLASRAFADLREHPHLTDRVPEES